MGTLIRFIVLTGEVASLIYCPTYQANEAYTEEKRGGKDRVENSKRKTRLIAALKRVKRVSRLRHSCAQRALGRLRCHSGTLHYTTSKL